MRTAQKPRTPTGARGVTIDFTPGSSTINGVSTVLFLVLGIQLGDFLVKHFSTIWRGRFGLWILLVATSVSVAESPASQATRSPSDPPPAKLKAPNGTTTRTASATNAEVVYLCNIAAELEGLLPNAIPYDDIAKEAIAVVYSKAGDYQLYVRERGMNQRLDKLFGAVRDSAQALWTVGSKLQDLPALVTRMKEEGAFNSGFNAGFDGTTAALELSDAGASAGGAMFGGLLVGIFTQVQEGNRVDEAARQTAVNISAEATAAYERDSAIAIQMMRMQARLISDDLEIHPTESGFFDPADSMQAEPGQTTPESIERRLSNLGDLRPGFPDLRIKVLLSRISRLSPPTQSVLMKTSAEVQSLADRIPIGSIYAERRGAYRMQALRLGLRGARIRADGSTPTGWSDAVPVPKGGLSVLMGRVLADTSTGAPNIEVLRNQYFALGFERDYSAALTIAQRALALAPSRLDIQFDVARLQSLLGNQAEAVKSLQELCRRGYVTAYQLRTSADLSGITSSQAVELAKLVAQNQLPPMFTAFESFKEMLLRYNLQGACQGAAEFVLAITDPRKEALDSRAEFEKWKEEVVVISEVRDGWRRDAASRTEWLQKLRGINSKDFNDAKAGLLAMSWLQAPGLSSFRAQIESISADRLIRTGEEITALIDAEFDRVCARGGSISAWALIGEAGPLLKQITANVKLNLGIDLAQYVRGVECIALKDVGPVIGMQFILKIGKQECRLGDPIWFQCVPRTATTPECWKYCAPTPAPQSLSEGLLVG